MITQDDMTRVAERLLGTCNSLDSALEEELGADFADVPIEMLEILDDQVLQCEQCGWWCESSEIDDDQACEDCREDHG